MNKSIMDDSIIDDWIIDDFLMATRAVKAMKKRRIRRRNSAGEKALKYRKGLKAIDEGPAKSMESNGVFKLKHRAKKHGTFLIPKSRDISAIGDKKRYLIRQQPHFIAHFLLVLLSEAQPFNDYQAFNEQPKA